ncbi:MULTISPECIES: NADPH-dependent FMN reductase [Frankia]|uniref:NADPH-dependent FMN reductase n=2 Tax=Frankia casuarinae (strain DSM 45818 / CECT 9043 / HFP020203 / CcI3) TaxID=106370 RepID=Q2J7D4_FRACC|nr:NADPH-dependent FMN reductase [Frankia casuarinae]OHV55463.1 NADPH-dependent FMN reductase [Frankia sp. CgIS1]
MPDPGRGGVVGDTFGMFQPGASNGEPRSGRSQTVGTDPVSGLPSRVSAHRSPDMPPDGPGPVRARRRRPLIVGIGGSSRANSTTHQALATVLAMMGQAGAETMLLGAADLDLPMYAPERQERPAAALRLLAAVERADGLVIATPGYHGGISGQVKNALDYLEDLRGAPRPYLDGRAVALIVGARGTQAAGTTLTALRSTVHALRGWPTPLGVTLNTAVPLFDPHGRVLDRTVAARLDTLADQIMGFTYAWSQVL